MVLVIGNEADENPVYGWKTVTKLLAGAVVVNELKLGVADADVVAGGM